MAALAVVGLGVLFVGGRVAARWRRRRWASALGGRWSRSGLAARWSVRAGAPTLGFAAGETHEVSVDLVVGEHASVVCDRGVLVRFGPGRVELLRSVRSPGPGRVVLEGEMASPLAPPPAFRLELTTADAPQIVAAFRPFAEAKPGTPAYADAPIS